MLRLNVTVDKQSVTVSVTIMSEKRYGSIAEKQRAYRERMKKKPIVTVRDVDQGSMTCPGCGGEETHQLGCPDKQKVVLETRVERDDYSQC